ncbi:hypothetical protein [Geodermatophilus sp. SYSU D01036]
MDRHRWPDADLTALTHLAGRAAHDELPDLGARLRQAHGYLAAGRLAAGSADDVLPV